MKASIQAIVLAAGKSTRFKTQKTKLLEKVCGQEIIVYTTNLLTNMAIPTTLVVGFQKEVIQETVLKHTDAITFACQAQQAGTGHALACSRDFWNKELILVLNGDTPLLTAQTIQTLVDQHIKANAAISFVTSQLSEPSSSYGRVIRDNQTIRIVEANEFTGSSQEYCCINAGVYLIDRLFLEGYLDKLEKNSFSNEFYITDLIAIASKEQKKVVLVDAPFDVVRGVNTLQELWIAEQIKRAEIIKYWMDNGIRFSAPDTTYIDQQVSIAAGTTISAGVHLLGTTIIGKDSTIEPYSYLENSTIGTAVTVKTHSIVKNSSIDNHSSVGPFAHIQNSTIGQESIIGNFVETQRTAIGNMSKAKHLSYLGDTTVGMHVNIGAGTITCNYDGTSKHKTTIADSVQIGSNTSLIAPVTINHNAVTAAGSVITHDVPEYSLAIARERQINKVGYSLHKNQKTPITQSNY